MDHYQRSVPILNPGGLQCLCNLQQSRGISARPDQLRLLSRFTGSTSYYESRIGDIDTERDHSYQDQAWKRLLQHYTRTAS